MNSMRLVIVTPRYWPHMGEIELAASHLAIELAELGVRPRVVTAKWGRDWPNEMVVQEIPLACVPHAPQGGWSTFRYMRDISRWLRQHRASYDAVYVMGLRHEAHAVIGTLHGTNTPLVLRGNMGGSESDCAWQERNRFGHRIKRRCMTADAIVATSGVMLEELFRSGYDQLRLRLVPPGALPIAARLADRRYRARSTLAEMSHDLAAPEYAPVVVYAGRLDELKPLSQLLRTWREVAARWPSARLWLLGEGSARNALYDEIVGMDLKYQVFMPGCFEVLSDVFLAADVFVIPQSVGGSQMILEAMAAGLPVVAAESPERRAMIDHGRDGLLIPADDLTSWTGALSQMCDQPAIAAEIGNAAQRKVEQRFSRRHSAQQHLELFDSLLMRRHA